LTLKAGFDRAMESALTEAKKDYGGGDDLGCHLAWIERKSVPDEVFEQAKDQSDLWFKKTRRDQHVPLYDRFDYLFTKAVLAHWDGDDLEAEKWFKEAEELYTTMELPMYHRQAFHYCVQANRAVLKSLQNNSSADVMITDLSRKNRINIEDPRCQAMILCLKAKFVGSFGQREGRMELFRRVPIL